MTVTMVEMVMITMVACGCGSALYRHRHPCGDTNASHAPTCRPRPSPLWCSWMESRLSGAGSRCRQLVNTPANCRVINLTNVLFVL
jgi:hypothetical protein